MEGNLVMSQCISPAWLKINRGTTFIRKDTQRNQETNISLNVTAYFTALQASLVKPEKNNLSVSHSIYIHFIIKA